MTLAGRLERKSETQVAVSKTRQLDGVVDVVDRLTYRLDSRTRPPSRGPHRVTEEWLRSL